MAEFSELEACAHDASAAASRLTASWPSLPVLPADASDQDRRAQRSIMASTARLQALLSQPADFLQRLALYNQLLACLQWLCEFQVLACIPLDGAVPFKDVADLSGVPETQLCRVARLMATAGFLQEPRPGHIAHSALSAQFVSQPALLDAAVFLSEVAAPSSFHMASATKRFAGSERPDHSAFNVALDTHIPLAGCFEQRPRLQRQFTACLSYATGDEDACVHELLMRLDWQGLGTSTVVDVGAPSTKLAITLASLFPALNFVVQTLSESSTPTSGLWSRTPVSNGDGGRLFTHALTGTFRNPSVALPDLPSQLSSRITLQQRIVGAPQLVRNAAVYLLRLPSPSPACSLNFITSLAASELSAHIEVLRANPGSRIILTALVLPVPGTVDLETEAAARLRDISLMQLANGRQPEVVELADVLNGVRDSSGGLVITNEIHSTSTPMVAFEAKYQAYDDPKP